MEDEDSAGGLAGYGLGASVLNGEAGEDAGSEFLRPKGGDRRSRLAAAVDDGADGAGGAGYGDGLAEEVDVLVISAGRDEDRVAVAGGVDAGLDGGLVSGNVDGRLGYRGRSEIEGE